MNRTNIFAVIAVVSLFMMATVVVGALAYAYVTLQNPPPIEADRRAVFSADDLQPYVNGLSLDTSSERIEVTRYFDDEWDIEYELDPTGDPEAPIYLWSMTTLSVSPEAARSAYQSVQVMANLAIQDTETIPADNLLSIGEKRSCKQLLDEDGATPFGASCAVLQGRVTMVVMIAGMSWTEPKSLDAVIEPALNRAGAYNPVVARRATPATPAVAPASP